MGISNETLQKIRKMCLMAELLYGKPSIPDRSRSGNGPFRGGRSLFPARPSAAHSAGIGLGAVVGGHRPAVVGIAAAAIQSSIPVSVAGEVQRPAVDGEVSVGVQAVPI